MKLRNKKTGEIKNVNHAKIMIHFNDGKTECVRSLAELNEDWEDYRELEKYYFIENTGYISETIFVEDDELDQKRLEIGNSFETKKETKKAVEKLKALTRLSKCGFRFEGYTDRDRANGGDIVIYAHVDIPNNNLLEEAQPDMLKDLDICFGSKDDC